VDTTPVYSRIYLIEIWSVFDSSLTEINRCRLRQYFTILPDWLLFRSAPAKNRRQMKPFISILSVRLAWLSLLKLSWIIRIYRFVCWTMLSEISSVMRQSHLSKSVVAFLAWPITSGNFVRIFCHLHWNVRRTFYPVHFVVFFPMNIIVSAAIIIRRSVFCIRRVTFSRFHIIYIGFRPVINDVNITSSDNITARIRSAFSALLR